MKSVKAQIKEIIKIIKKDATEQGTLIIRKDKGRYGYCVVGGLARFGAKVTPTELGQMNTSQVAVRVEAAFPILTYGRTTALMSINDSIDRLAARLQKPRRKR